MASSASSALWRARSSRSTPDPRGSERERRLTSCRAAPMRRSCSSASARSRSAARRRVNHTRDSASSVRPSGHEGAKVMIIARGGSRHHPHWRRLRGGSDPGGKTFRASDTYSVMANVQEAGDLTLLTDAGVRRRIDHRAAERAAADLLRALGADLRSPGLHHTPPRMGGADAGPLTPRSPGLPDPPRRMADAYAELLPPEPFRATTFPNEDGYDELVMVRAIPFHSLCMHHLLPFPGVAHVGYLPGERIIGLSKLARVVDLFARDLQVQEGLTKQIADWLEAELEPKGVGVVLEAEHLCMSLRGVQKTGARTVTSALQGLIRDDPRTRQEFLALTKER